MSRQSSFTAPHNFMDALIRFAEKVLRMLKQLIIAALITTLPLSLAISHEQNAMRIVSASNPITQIISALEKEEMLVGIDTTSHTKPSLEKIPDIGYRITLSTEGILSLKPDLILLAHDSGPLNVIEQLHHSGVDILHFEDLKDVAAIESTIHAIAEKLDIQNAGIALSETVIKEASQLAQKSQNHQPLKGFFVLQEEPNAGSLQISGNDTTAHKLLELLNITNLFGDDFKNYRAISLENQMQTRPDIVFIGKRASFDPKKDASSAVIPPFQLRESGMKSWPDALQPQCVFEVNMSHYLVYGIHIFQDSTQLLTAIEHCLAER